MTKLTDARKIKKVKLPSYPDVEVLVFDGLLTYQIGDLDAIENNYDKGLKSLEFLIKSWSFVDDEEKPLAATIDNLRLLPLKDFTALMDAAAESMKVAEEKKRKN